MLTDRERARRWHIAGVIAVFVASFLAGSVWRSVEMALLVGFANVAGYAEKLHKEEPR